MGWDEARQITVVQRYKESAEEYRYFPEPDLPVIEVSREWAAQVRAELPELPDAKRDRFINSLGLTRYDASVLVAERAVADYYEGVLAEGANPKSATNWMIGSLFSLLNTSNVEREDIGSIKIVPKQLAALIKMVDSGILNKNTASAVLSEMWETGEDPARIVERKGLAQISDTSVIDQAIEQMMADNPDWVTDYLGGKDKLFGPMVGKTMGILGGKGDPKVVRERLQAALDAKK
jgi:aspartyl-tRNA(Asn)/glutamyl-tRNA(Gln) amidotransferase subunit B